MPNFVPRTVILDNGAYRMKVGYAGDEQPRFIPNSIVKSKSDRKRIYIADELDECTDKSGLYYVLPFERGYLVNWDVQLDIWDRVFGKNGMAVDFQESRLVLTDPSDICKAVRDVSPEIAFEAYQYQAFLRTSAPSCVAYDNYMRDNGSLDNSACLVIDSGHSFTHIVPFIEGKMIKEGIVRIDVGGKVLTNQLKEWISYRQLNVLEETYIMNQCKEDVCFVSTDLQRDIERLISKANPPLRRDYLLPDFVSSHRGSVVEPTLTKIKTEDAIDDRAKISVGVERVATPEILFHPSDIDVPQLGIPEAIQYSLERVREVLSSCSELDLRPLVADCFDFSINTPTDPMGHAWRSVSHLLTKVDDNEVAGKFASKFVTRAEYNENGTNICRLRFNNFHITEY